MFSPQVYIATAAGHTLTVRLPTVHGKIVHSVATALQSLLLQSMIAMQWCPLVNSITPLTAVFTL